jgi:hypothetical protein
MSFNVFKDFQSVLNIIVCRYSLFDIDAAINLFYFNLNYWYINKYVFLNINLSISNNFFNFIKL